MKIAVASMGRTPEALVGQRFGTCSQFLIFDTETEDFVTINLSEGTQDPEKVSLAAIRAVAQQGVSTVITGQIKDICRTTMLNLGIDVVEGVESMTVQEALERYRATGLETPESRRGWITRIAVAAEGEGMDALLQAPLHACTSFVIVDPQTDEWEKRTFDAPPSGPEGYIQRVRAVVESGAGVLITPKIHVECCTALQALAVQVYTAPEGIRVDEAIRRYEAGELEERGYAF